MFFVGNYTNHYKIKHYLNMYTYKVKVMTNEVFKLVYLNT